jgi:hypothetical protein
VSAWRVALEARSLGSVNHRENWRPNRSPFRQTSPNTTARTRGTADQVAITRSMLEKRKIDRELEETEDWFRAL